MPSGLARTTAAVVCRNSESVGQVVHRLGESVQGRLAAVDGVRRVPIILEHRLHQFRDLGLVVHHEDAGHAVSLTSARAASSR